MRPESFQVLNTFTSVAGATNQTGAFRPGILAVLRENQRLCGSFFWRRQGSARLPVPLPSKIVEKVSLETRDILEQFESITMTANSVNASIRSINKVLRGEQRSCKGYFWSFEGSNKIAPLLQRVARAVEKLNSDGKIVETYLTVEKAAQALNLRSSRNMYYAARGKIKSCRGFYWRFKGSDKQAEGAIQRSRQ